MQYKLGGNRLLAAFFGTAEGKQQRFSGMVLRRIFAAAMTESTLGGRHSGQHAIPEYQSPLHDRESFRFHAGDIFRHQRDDDFSAPVPMTRSFTVTVFIFYPFSRGQPVRHRTP